MKFTEVKFNMNSKLGEWAFIVGLVLAIVVSFFSAGDWAGLVTLVLVIVGLIVGFLNVSEKETTPFLVAAIALIATGTADLEVINGIVPNVGTWLQNIVHNIAVLVSPAAIVVALKAIRSLAKD